MIKARVLTEDEYVDILREKEKEAAGKKEQNRQERERKKALREEARLKREKKEE